MLQILAVATGGALIGFSFYLGSKIVDRYLKVLEKSQWKNFVIAIIGFTICTAISVGILSFLLP